MDLTPKQLAALSRRERSALRLASLVNESPRAKAATRWFSETITRHWMTLVSSRRMNLVGMEKMEALRPDRGVLLAANHRSFFDMFMVLTYLHRRVSFCERFYFPVRSAFWYDHPAGWVVNGIAAGMAMYPPIFRETEKRDITRLGLDFLAEALAKPGTVVGVHPEGTRGKGPDPYELLPAEQGFGRIVLGSHPIVVPIFINGMTNDFITECRSTLDGTGIPILIVFGDPVDLSEFEGEDPQRLRAQINVGRKVLGEIAKLAELEKRVRAELGRGAKLDEAVARARSALDAERGVADEPAVVR
ncbi:MAG TPA: lysophospholipid acyltransferase family protein [Polyangiaceae bacterium]|nr:lysophospholipid acyltransferase family protein [Polyangiaceae bacterium]